MFSQWEIFCNWFNLINMEHFKQKPYFLIQLLARDSVEIWYHYACKLTLWICKIKCIDTNIFLFQIWTATWMGVSLCLNTNRNVIHIRLYCKLHNTISQIDKKGIRPVHTALMTDFSMNQGSKKANKYWWIIIQVNRKSFLKKD